MGLKKRDERLTLKGWPLALFALKLSCAYQSKNARPVYRTVRPIVIPLVAVLVVLITLLGSIPAIRMLLKLQPAEVLHGR
jgi:ABC-type antimicrobial peptide transport system permease subunit